MIKEDNTMTIKTLALTGAEISANGLDGCNAAIRNDSTEAIYVSKKPGITIGAEGVLSIPAGGSAAIFGISRTIYILGRGSAIVVSSDYNENPFKSAAQGGSGADDVARAAITTHAGNADIHVTAAEKAGWNNKAELSDIPPSLPANGGNSDTIDGKHADDFIYARGYFDSIDLNEIRYPCSGLATGCSNAPTDKMWGTLI
ncbi:MAG: hypothetical protein J6A19_12475, partial [Oscillospiraceae bacterium]|nr:hypothetical protein [Oscillospiraceae bacterium]